MRRGCEGEGLHRDDFASWSPARLAALLLSIPLGALGGCGPTYTEVASGTDLLLTRPPLAEDGTVVAAAADRLLVSDGATSTTIDLTALSLSVSNDAELRRAMQVRRPRGGAGGDVVFMANHSGVPGCAPAHARGAYRIDPAGGTLITLLETCVNLTVALLGHSIAMSPGGQVAFSQIENGMGALYRGPAAGPVTVLQSGSGDFYNLGEVDINDAGRVVVQAEYSDVTLWRGILALDKPQQPVLSHDSAIEKMDVGSQPSLAINAAGTVAFSLDSGVTIQIAGTSYTYYAGVYTAVPTPIGTPKSITLVADLSGPYCRVGRVDINDHGTVVFEATLRGSGGTCGSTFDGIFYGADPGTSRIVQRGNQGLGTHQSFDDIVLGEINSRGSVSFATSSAADTSAPVRVWRADPR